MRKAKFALVSEVGFSFVGDNLIGQCGARLYGELADYGHRDISFFVSLIKKKSKIG